MSTGALNVLLVDDDPVGAELTAAVIADLGLAVAVERVDDGEEALDYLFRRGLFGDRAAPDPDVILLDLKMPKIDGHEVLRQIRADPELKAMRVIMLTSSDRERDMLQSRDLGADAYVCKAVSIEEMTSRLRALGPLWTGGETRSSLAP
jgi:CheY-like chemotaxis protein